MERVHRSVRTGLICKYLEDKIKFDINKSLIQVLNSYNNVVHSTTKKNQLMFFFQMIKTYLIMSLKILLIQVKIIKLIFFIIINMIIFFYSITLVLVMLKNKIYIF